MIVAAVLVDVEGEVVVVIVVVVVVFVMVTWVVTDVVEVAVLVSVAGSTVDTAALDIGDDMAVVVPARSKQAWLIDPARL